MDCLGGWSCDLVGVQGPTPSWLHFVPYLVTRTPKHIVSVT